MPSIHEIKVMITARIEKLQRDLLPELDDAGKQKIYRIASDQVHAELDEAALQALMAWLQDNVDGESEISFDNDGRIKSADVLAALTAKLY
jgi:hypothetical protein